MDIGLQTLKIISKEIKKGRWELILGKEGGGRVKMPQANYVWLLGNASFKEVPAGYLVHHLDLDPLNDDISNLALMYRHHHTAYHFKHKNQIVQVKFTDQNGTAYAVPRTEPKIKTKNGGRSFYLDFWSRNGDGRSERKKIYSFEGLAIPTEEKAKDLICHLWPDTPWNFNLCEDRPPFGPGNGTGKNDSVSL